MIPLLLFVRNVIELFIGVSSKLKLSMNYFNTFYCTSLKYIFKNTLRSVTQVFIHTRFVYKFILYVCAGGSNI